MKSEIKGLEEILQFGKFESEFHHLFSSNLDSFSIMMSNDEQGSAEEKLEEVFEVINFKQISFKYMAAVSENKIYVMVAHDHTT